MKQEGLKYFTDTYMTSVGLMIFFLFFVGVLFWVYRKSSTETYAALEKAPFDDGDRL